jgi:hypothetical protein
VHVNNKIISEREFFMFIIEIPGDGHSHRTKPVVEVYISYYFLISSIISEHKK